jgi:hypothetical protein
MPYSKGTGLSINAGVKKSRVNPARTGRQQVMIPSTGNAIHHSVPVARKPAKNKAAK